MVPNFFTFFFTHEHQLCNKAEGVRRWLFAPLHLRSLQPAAVDTYNFLVLNYAETLEGYQLTVDIDQGWSPVLCSRGSELNPEIITVAGQTTQRYLSLTASADLANLRDEADTLLPGEPPGCSYVERESYTTEIVLPGSQSITTQTSVYEDIQTNGTHETRTWTSPELIAGTYHVSGIFRDASRSLELRELPHGFARSSLAQAATLHSQLLSSAPTGRGYLPATSLSTTMTGVSLPELALSLVGLCALEEEALLLSAIDEILYVWAQRLGNLDSDGQPTQLAPGLPSNLLRQPTTYTKARSTVDQAWLGWSLCQVCFFLRDRKTSQRLDLPPSLLLLLQQLAELVANAVDPVSGETATGYDSNLNLQSSTSLEAAIWSTLFLESYLKLDYSPFVHARAAVAHNRVLATLPASDLSVTSQTYRLLWLLRQAPLQQPYTLLESCAASIDSANQLDLLLLFTYAVSQFKQLTNLQVATLLQTAAAGWLPPGDWDDLTPAILIEQFKIDLNVYGAGDTPTLTASSWCVLTDSDYNLFASPAFDLSAAAGQAAAGLASQIARWMLPFGYQWSGERFEQPDGTNLGTLVYALGQLTFNWWLRFQQLAQGLYVRLAQGWMLDRWGSDLNRSRPLLQSDSFYRQMLNFWLARPLSTEAALRLLGTEVYGVDLDLVNDAAEFLPIEQQLLVSPQHQLILGRLQLLHPASVPEAQIIEYLTESDQLDQLSFYLSSLTFVRGVWAPLVVPGSIDLRPYDGLNIAAPEPATNLYLPGLSCERFAETEAEAEVENEPSQSTSLSEVDPDTDELTLLQVNVMLGAESSDQLVTVQDPQSQAPAPVFDTLAGKLTVYLPEFATGLVEDLQQVVSPGVKAEYVYRFSSIVPPFSAFDVPLTNRISSVVSLVGASVTGGSVRSLSQLTSLSGGSVSGATDRVISTNSRIGGGSVTGGRAANLVLRANLAGGSLSGGRIQALSSSSQLSGGSVSGGVAQPLSQETRVSGGALTGGVARSLTTYHVCRGGTVSGGTNFKLESISHGGSVSGGSLIKLESIGAGGSVSGGSFSKLESNLYGGSVTGGTLTVIP